MRRGEAILLLAVVAAGAIPAIVFVHSLTEFVIMPDELGYVKQATVLGHGELVRPGEMWFNSWALLYPAILAPLYHWLSSTQAFDIGHSLGAVLMASTAIPVYLLARAVVGRQPAALLAALLTVAVPWLAMSGTVMTEVVAYPAFAWALLAATRAAARPGTAADLLLLAALGVAFFARTQLILLAPAAAGAILLHALAYRDAPGPALQRLRASVVEHWAFFGALALGAIIVALAGSTRFIGAYSATTEGDVFQPQTFEFARETLAYVVVGIGVVPLATGVAWIVLTLARGRGSRSAHAFACVALLAGLEVVLVGGAFSARFGGGINERYVFYLAPPLFIATAAGLLRRPPGWRAALAVAGAGTVWLVASSRLAQQGPSLLTPSTALHTALNNAAGHLGLTTAGLMATAGAVAIAALLLVPSRVPSAAVAGATLGVLLVFCGFETAYTYSKVAATQAGSSRDFVARRGWLDRALPDGARTAIILTSFGAHSTTTVDWWDTAFWNKTITGIHYLPGSDKYETLAQPLPVDPTTGRMAELDPYDYFLRSGFDTRVSLRDSTTVTSSGGYLVIKAARPYRAEWLMAGGNPETGSIPPGATATVRAWRAAQGATTTAVGVTLQSPPGVTKPIHVLIRAAGSAAIDGVLAPGERRTFESRAHYGRDGFTDLRIGVPANGPGPVMLIAVAQP